MNNDKMLTDNIKNKLLNFLDFAHEHNCCIAKIAYLGDTYKLTIEKLNMEVTKW